MSRFSPSACLAASALLSSLVGCLSEAPSPPETNTLAAILKDPERTLMMHVLYPRSALPPLDVETRTQLEALADRGDATAKNVLYVDYERRIRIELAAKLDDAISSRNPATVDRLVKAGVEDGIKYMKILHEAHAAGNERARANFLRIAIEDEKLLSSTLGAIDDWKDPDAILQVALFLHKGESVSGAAEPQHEEALRWSLKAAEHGGDDALILTAELYRLRGEYARSLEFAARAAVNGDPDGLYAHGLCRYIFSLEEKSPQDHAIALSTIRRSAAKGHLRAKQLLAAIYIEGDEYQPPRPRDALPLLQELAGTRDPFALRELAILSFNGLSDNSEIIVPIDRPRALALLQDAADVGDEWSDSMLADYRNNEKIRSNEEHLFNEHMAVWRRDSERQEKVDRRIWIRWRISGKL